MKRIEEVELSKILEEHKKCINSNREKGKCADLSYTDLRGANLSYTDLKYANLRCADLRGAYLGNADLRGANLMYAKLIGTNLISANLNSTNLKYANLKGANIDYSSYPISCRSLNVHVDDRITIQLLYHVLKNVEYSKNVSEDVKKILLKPEIVELANKFHRVEECGKIKEYKG